MIQDIYPRKLYNEYEKDRKVSATSKVLSFIDGKVLVQPGEELTFPTAQELGMDLSYIYLFRVDEDAYFLLRDEKKPFITEDELSKLPGFAYHELREIRGAGLGRKDQMYAVYTGKHLSDWYRDMRFCGRCGTKMGHSEKERAMHCSACGYTAYPRIMPAVIVGVTRDDEILLTKYRKGYRNFALIAGFTEIGETIEETVAREVMEEAGLRVKNIRYYKSQPWGSANDILMGFYCDVEGDSEIHMDKEELRYAEWTKREEIELQPDDFSLTNEMMMMFKEGKNI